MTLELEIDKPKREMSAETKAKILAAKTESREARERGRIDFDNIRVYPIEDEYWVVQEVKDGREGEMSYYPSLDYAVLNVLNRKVSAKAAKGCADILDSIKTSKAEILRVLQSVQS